MGSDIYAISRDGIRLRPIVSAARPADSWNETTTTFSLAPDGSRMVYATCEFADPTKLRFDYHELAVLDLDRPDAPPRRLTTDEAFDYYSAWSPDGQHIAFHAGRPYTSPKDDREGVLKVMGADGTRPQWVRGGEALIGPPRWSPDGRWLAFVNDDGEEGLGLYIVNADRTDLRRLSDAASEPSWSPDSRQLAFIRWDGGQLALYTIEIDSDDAAAQRVRDFSDDRLLARLPSARWPPAAWSPDGRWLAFVDDDDEEGPGLYFADAEGIIRRRLSGAASDLSWSTDSRKLTFIRWEGEQRARYTIDIDLDDAVEQWVANIPGERWPKRFPLVAWAPSGAYIVYECQDERLCIVVRSSGTLLGGAPLYGQAVAWSPDGSRLAVVVGELDRSQSVSVTDKPHLDRLLGGDSSVKVYTVAPDGSDLRPLVREREDGGLVAAAAT